MFDLFNLHIDKCEIYIFVNFLVVLLGKQANIKSNTLPWLNLPYSRSLCAAYSTCGLFIHLALSGAFLSMHTEHL